MSDGRLPARRRWIGWTIGTLVVLLILAVGWIVVRGAGAISELRNVERSASQLRSSIAESDTERAQRIAPRIAQHAALAHSLTSDPVWRAFEILPWVGRNFTALREIGEIADDAAEEAVTSMLEASAHLDLATLSLAGAKIDVIAFADAEAPLANAAVALSQADLKAQQVDAEGVIAPLSDAVRDMRDAIAETATTVGALHGASVLLRPMLGSEEPRNYLVVLQNNAEVLSVGGSVASLTLVRAEGGTVSIERQASANEFPVLGEPIALSDGAVALFDDRPGRSIQDVTSIPAFPEAGAIIAARWEQTFGGTVDGVIALDMVAARHLLEATGAVTFGAYTADTDTLLPLMLSTLYADVADVAQQNAVFAQAAHTLFAAVLNRGDPQQVLGALATAASEGRIRIWSVHSEQQELLASSNLGGTLPADGERGTYVGVLFNDLTGGRMNYYTTAAITTAVGICHGEPTTEVTVTWTNEAPVDAEEPLPTSVTGAAHEGAEPGDVRTLIAIYGPEGAGLGSPSSEGESARNATIGERTFVQQEVTVPPGESATVTATFTGEPAGEPRLRVVHTPLLDNVKITRKELVCN